MSSTLIDSVRSVFTEPLIAKLSVLLGEPEGNIKKALHGSIPLVLTEIVHKAYFAEGVGRVDTWARQAAASDFFGQLHELTNGTGGLVPGSILLNKGAEYSKALLNQHSVRVNNEIGRYANISVASASFIVGVVSFAALDTVGRHIANSSVDGNGLAAWLKMHADGVVAAIPEGLQVKQALGISHYPWDRSIGGRRSSGLYLILVLIVLALVIFFAYRSCHTEAVVVTTGKDTVVTSSAPVVVESKTETPTVKVELPNGKVLDAYKGGTEDRLVAFLGDSHAKLNKKDGNWFDFTQINFASNSSSLLLESDRQLKNIVSILDAFPHAKIKIGGYSDNTGDSTDNVKLSQQRADNISAKLKELGAKGSQLVGSEGYGPKYPMGDNGTAAGRAMNRRMSINVKAK